MSLLLHGTSFMKLTVSIHGRHVYDRSLAACMVVTTISKWAGRPFSMTAQRFGSHALYNRE